MASFVAYMPLVTLAPMASEIYHRDLTNRVGLGHVCGANVQRANLLDADLQDADLSWANLAGVIYEPKPESLPKFWTLISPRLNILYLVCPRIASTDVDD